MKPQDYTQPAAYDTEGRPLYLHPPTGADKQKDTNARPHTDVEVVQVTRANDPVPVTVSADMQRRHDESMRLYPFLNLSDGEYVVSHVQRHPIALFGIWLAMGIVIVFILFAWWFIMTNPGGEKPLLTAQAAGSASMIALGLTAFMGMIGLVATVIFFGNKFFVTNESAIQEIQTSLLAKKEQTINLENIKDVSYTQSGLLPQLFNYGTIRLSTEGDQQEYVFTYVKKPNYYVSLMNNVVEAVQYGRPIEDALKKVKPE